ncbi:hypothetical protein HPB58_06470 [Priestia filamentosa]|uniref:hypothetical protein n=1 Tax=Priestia filamentosa TaxID=1402861 RepID=UPI001FB3F6F8|nr:hypothetical protein [Priestia filamentosa]UOE61814.1 hypothetical protein HPB58_06470 [Priestia filamentosa]
MFIAIVLAILFSILSVVNTNKLISLKGDLSLKGLAFQTRILMITPIAALIILSAVIFNFHSLYGERIPHALLVLSMWMLMTNTLFIYRNIKSKNLNLITTVVLGAMSLCAAIYLTPLDRYNTLFNRHYYIVPLTISVVFIAITYLNLMRIRKVCLPRKIKQIA